AGRAHHPGQGLPGRVRHQVHVEIDGDPFTHECFFISALGELWTSCWLSRRLRTNRTPDPNPASPHARFLPALLTGAPCGEKGIGAATKRPEAQLSQGLPVSESKEQVCEHRVGKKLVPV